MSNGHEQKVSDLVSQLDDQLETIRQTVRDLADVVQTHKASREEKAKNDDSD